MAGTPSPARLPLRVVGDLIITTAGDNHLIAVYRYDVVSIADLEPSQRLAKTRLTLTNSTMIESVHTMAEWLDELVYGMGERHAD